MRPRYNTTDNCLSMDSHVNETVRNCNFHLQALRHIRPSVTREVANMIACSIVTSRIDYCNSPLLGVSAGNLNKLQRIQNCAARIVCNANRRDASSRDHVIFWSTYIIVSCPPSDRIQDIIAVLPSIHIYYINRCTCLN